MHILTESVKFKSIDIRFAVKRNVSSLKVLNSTLGYCAVVPTRDDDPH